MDIKKTIILILVAVFVTIIYRNYLANNFKGNELSMKLSTPLFSDGGYIPETYTCDGEDARVFLKIMNAPENSKSLVLIVNDTDAISSNYIHWIVWNIPPRIRGIEGDLLPEGALEGKNSANKIGWLAPCPTSGLHHYNFTLYALDIKLSIPEFSKYVDIKNAMEGHIIEDTLLVGLYQKKMK